MANNTPSDVNEATKPKAPPFWNDPQKRALVFQIVIAAAVILFFGYLFSNTLTNLEKRGISTGFDFLNDSAGFGITQTLVSYTESDSFGRVFIVGLLNTLLVAALSVLLATILGFLIGIARLSDNWLLSKSAMVYIETFRNIPLLLQILFWYFAILPLAPSPRESASLIDLFFLNNRGLSVPGALPQEGFSWTIYTFFGAIVVAYLVKRWAKRRQDTTGQQFPVFWASLGIIITLPLIVFIATGSPLQWDIPELGKFRMTGGWTIIPELAALLIALSIYSASFIAEVVRSGIQGVSSGQTEAASALGIKHGHTLRLVVIPQAMRIIIPQLTSQYLNITKNSSLAAAIGYPDLVAVFAGTSLNQTGQAIEIIFMTMLVYLTISLLISVFMNWYNKRMALVER